MIQILKKKELYFTPYKQQKLIQKQDTNVDIFILFLN